MDRKLVANATTQVAAPPGRVWDALVTPKAIKEYMFGADVESDWTEGSGITWKGEMKGKQFEDKGVVLKVEPERTLQYTHFSPMSGQADRPENYHTVTIQLIRNGDRTDVSLSQDNNLTEEAKRESEKNWKTMLGGLKEYVEGGK